MKSIKEFDKHVRIAGFRNVRIKDTGGFLEKIAATKGPKVEIQVFNADCVVTWQHLYFAVLNALKAFKNQENLSKSLAMEIMLYASTQHQIQKAMRSLGVKSSLMQIGVVIIGEDVNAVRSALSMISKSVEAQRDDSVLELTNGKTRNIKRIFGISDTEIGIVMKDKRLEQALVDLIVERMALLATER